MPFGHFPRMPASWLSEAWFQGLLIIRGNPSSHVTNSSAFPSGIYPQIMYFIMHKVAISLSDKKPQHTFKQKSSLEINLNILFSFKLLHFFFHSKNHIQERKQANYYGSGKSHQIKIVLSLYENSMMLLLLPLQHILPTCITTTSHVRFPNLLQQNSGGV